MLDEEQGTLKSILPDWVHGSLTAEERDRLDAALLEDEDLRHEADLVQRLLAAQPQPPGDLVARIQARVATDVRATAGRPRRVDRRGSTGPTWRWSAAAVFVLALGTAVVWQNRRGPPPSLPSLDGAVPESWLLDDGVVAGGLVLDELTEDALSSLLEELER